MDDPKKIDARTLIEAMSNYTRGLDEARKGWAHVCSLLRGEPLAAAKAVDDALWSGALDIDPVLREVFRETRGEAGTQVGQHA